MSAERNFTDQDYELLSAYLDGALTPNERTALETQLQTDDGLRQELESLHRDAHRGACREGFSGRRGFLPEKKNA